MGRRGLVLPCLDADVRPAQAVEVVKHGPVELLFQSQDHRDGKAERERPVWSVSPSVVKGALSDDVVCRSSNVDGPARAPVLGLESRQQIPLFRQLGAPHHRRSVSVPRRSSGAQRLQQRVHAVVLPHAVEILIDEPRVRFVRLQISEETHQIPAHPKPVRRENAQYPLQRLDARRLVPVQGCDADDERPGLGAPVRADPPSLAAGLLDGRRGCRVIHARGRCSVSAFAANTKSLSVSPSILCVQIRTTTRPHARNRSG